MSFAVRQDCGAKYTAVLLNEASAPVAGSTLTTLKLTLWDYATRQILNGRDLQDVKNANNVTIDESGNLAWYLQPNDNALIGTVAEGVTESHRAKFEWTWGTGQQGSWVITLAVQATARVP